MKKFEIKAIIHGSIVKEILDAISKEEAVGKFLIKYSCNCYDNIKSCTEI